MGLYAKQTAEQLGITEDVTAGIQMTANPEEILMASMRENPEIIASLMARLDGDEKLVNDLLYSFCKDTCAKLPLAMGK
jgi:hypothetical protein